MDNSNRDAERKKPLLLKDLLPYICKRPAMYAGSPGFDHMVAFINGYDSALAACAPEDYNPNEMRDFSDWLSKKFGTPRNWHWAGAIRKTYSDDQTCLAKLQSLFEEFCQQKQR